MSEFQPKLCKFCDQQVSYEPLAELEKHGTKVYFCHPCQAEYVYWANGSAASTSIYRTYKDKMYRWTVSPNKDMSYLVYVKNPGIPGSRLNENMQILQVFRQDIPNITPDNFIDKLSVYLIFL